MSDFGLNGTFSKTFIENTFRKTITGPASVPSVGFSVLSLSPEVWIDASDASTLTMNGSTIGQLNDKSGNSRHAVQPSLESQGATAATISGLSAISNIGAEKQWFDIPATNVLEVYGVIEGDRICFLAAASGGAPELFFWPQQDRASFDGVGSGSGSWSVNGSAYVGPVANASDVGLEVGVPAIVAGQFSAPVSAETILGRVDYSVTTGNAKFGELIAFNRALSASEKSDLENYLSTKWSIAV